MIPRLHLTIDGKRITATVGSDVTVYVGDYYEKTGAIAKTYYSLGGARAAMRNGGALSWLLTDHLGSTALNADTSAVRQAEIRYTAWGVSRYTSGTMPTDFRYTGQREDASIGLYYYGARWYDPALGRFVQADTIVPGAGNPQALNRYSYVLNNPLRYIDPSGYDPLDQAWEDAWRAEHCSTGARGCNPTDDDRRNRLFSLLFSGSGPGGSWTSDDWALYGTRSYRYRDQQGTVHIGNRFWTDQRWPGAASPGLARFAAHVSRLASFYVPAEVSQFVRAFALIFGGVPYDMHWTLAAWEVRHGPSGPTMYEGVEGWNPWLYENGQDNPSHHYAGLFFLGYFAGPHSATVVNLGRDYDNPPDILLGQIAVTHGYAIRWVPDLMKVLGLAIVGSFRNP